MDVQLRKLGPNSKTKILKVPEECQTKIWLAGRGTSCQIYTKSKYASRQHFSITYRDQKYYISDLQSANGTFLNDEKLTREKMLTFGNVISVGVPSEMQNSPDGIVYLFEPCLDFPPSEKQVPVPPENEEVKSTINGMISMDVDPPLANKEALNESSPNNPENDNEKTTLNNIELIDLSDDSESYEPKPSKIRKIEELPPVKKEEIELVKAEKPEKPGENKKDDDALAYEALTQVDSEEPEVKKECDLLNYSLTEELIELSDSEDDWSSGLKTMEGNKSPEEEDEDDDVLVLETIIKSRDSRATPDWAKLGEELTETDRKWVEKLLSIKEENIEREDVKPAVMKVPPDTQDNRAVEQESDVALSTEQLRRLDVEDRIPAPTPETIPAVELPRKIVKRVVPKKSVSFDMVPQIRYFEIPCRSRLTASEKGRLRFARVIYNICNWNSHWLEECRKVAPDKDPPGICEEKIRRIPKKFLCHFDYMLGFVPVMLLQLWNKVKDKWVNSGDSGFRQTVSCDSCEDNRTENLSIYKCTGLVQSVKAHSQLIREGHLVLLRLYQTQSPQYSNPASEKYSKKLGYVVFGFVESRAYERFHNQPIHEALAERCGSIVGDLHIVRLTILVKKRPNFILNKKKLIQLTVVEQISQEIRMFKGICFLPDSLLCSAILRPSKTEISTPEPATAKLVFKGPVDDVQRDVIKKLSHAISLTNSFLYSVHGAAGTGKGQVIIGLITQLLLGDEWKSRRPKIIYCCPKSVPLDEMIIRLRKTRETMNAGFDLVRVGPMREVKPEVKDLNLGSLAAQLRNTEKKYFDPETEVLRRADVICTTCMSSGISKMLSAFEKCFYKDRNRKIVCIIDEAMNCKEIEAVVPLLLGVTHLILVGDIYQMEPPLSGERAHSLGLDMPLFWRIYKNFENVSKELWPIHILKTQYRMNSSLSKFTSLLIYSAPLLKPAVPVSERMGKLRSHLLLVNRTSDVVVGKKENDRIWTLSILVKAVTKLAREIAKGARLGVILCDTRQMENLQSLLPKRDFPEVEIDSVPGIQGKEFEIVVILFEGRKLFNSWIATALTRARCSLFIFTTEQSIDENSFLRRIADDAEKYKFVKCVSPEMTVTDLEKIVTGSYHREGNV